MQTYSARFIGGPEDNTFRIVDSTQVAVYSIDYASVRIEVLFGEEAAKPLPIRRGSYLKSDHFIDGHWLYLWGGYDDEI